MELLNNTTLDNDGKKTSIAVNKIPLREVLKELNLLEFDEPKLFKEKPSPQIEVDLERLIPETFYNTQREALKTGFAVASMLGGIVALVGGMSAESLPLTGLGMISTAGTFAWTGIRAADHDLAARKIKKNLEKELAIEENVIKKTASNLYKPKI